MEAAQAVHRLVIMNWVIFWVPFFVVIMTLIWLKNGGSFSKFK